MRNLVVFALPFAIACTGSSPQVLTGHVASGFPAQATTIKVVRGTTTVTSAPIAADGTFKLTVPPGSGLTLRLVGTGQDNLVMPRHAGTIDRTFAVHGGGVPFDLGALYFVGPSTGTNFAFHDATGGADCQDGHDASGATCVDDGDNHGGSCEADDNETEGGDGTDARVLAADDGPDDGDAVPEHNFPGDGCADGGDNGGDS